MYISCDKNPDVAGKWKQRVIQRRKDIMWFDGEWGILFWAYRIDAGAEQRHDEVDDQLVGHALVLHQHLEHAAVLLHQLERERTQTLLVAGSVLAVFFQFVFYSLHVFSHNSEE